MIREDINFEYLGATTNDIKVQIYDIYNRLHTREKKNLVLFIDKYLPELYKDTCLKAKITPNNVYPEVRAFILNPNVYPDINNYIDGIKKCLGIEILIPDINEVINYNVERGDVNALMNGRRLIENAINSLGGAEGDQMVDEVKNDENLEEVKNYENLEEVKNDENLELKELHEILEDIKEDYRDWSGSELASYVEQRGGCKIPDREIYNYMRHTCELNMNMWWIKYFSKRIWGTDKVEKKLTLKQASDRVLQEFADTDKRYTMYDYILGLIQHNITAPNKKSIKDLIKEHYIFKNNDKTLINFTDKIWDVCVANTA